MSDNNMDKVSQPTEDGKGGASTWPTVAGRCPPDLIYLIDRAALELGKKRGHFVVDAAVERAREVLAAGPRAA